MAVERIEASDHGEEGVLANFFNILRSECPVQLPYEMRGRLVVPVEKLVPRGRLPRATPSN